ncbi:MAG: TIGR02611 family protein [Nakamurella sp.]
MPAEDVTDEAADDRVVLDKRYGDRNVTLDSDEDDWAWRAKIKSNPTTKLIYRIVVAIVGVGIVVLGFVLLPAPGPGWLIIFAGLGVLASEFEWAQRVLEFAKKHVRRWTSWVGRQSWWVKGLVGMGILIVVLAAFYLLFWLSGVPTWLPDFLERPLTSLPGLD